MDFNTFKRDNAQEKDNVIRWFETETGDVISIVKRFIDTRKGPKEDQEYYEIRATIGAWNAAIPCGIEIEKQMSDERVLSVVERVYNRPKSCGGAL